MTSPHRQRVLFLCTQNSARSQMSEGWLRHLAGDDFEVESAGTAPASRVHPLAVRVMQEAAINISGQQPKSVDRLVAQRFDYVITVCDRARDDCPVFPQAGSQLHWGIDDPAAVQGTLAARLAAFRRTCDEIAARVRSLLADRPSTQP